MQFIRNSIFTRSDTLLGVCQALGEDFGVSPTWFRVGFAAVVVVNIEAALLAYAAAGALVFVSRMVLPGRASAAAVDIASVPTAEAAQPDATPEAAQVPAMAQAA